MKNFAGMSWATNQTGRVLFRPHPSAPTSELSVEEFRRIDNAKKQELAAALITGLPLAVMSVLWFNGGLDWRWMIVAVAAYGAFNTIFYYRSRSLIRDLVRTAPESGEQLPPVDTHKLIAGALRDAGSRWMSDMGGVIRLMGWTLGFVGVSWLLLGAVSTGNPVLWIGTILLGYLLWEIVFRRPRRK